MLNGARAASPYIPAYEHTDNELVNRLRMHRAVLRPAIDRARAVRASGGNQAVRKSHAPGKMRWLAVVAVAGDEAADPAHGVTDGRGGAGNIQHGKHVHAVTAGDQKQCGNAG